MTFDQTIEEVMNSVVYNVKVWMIYVQQEKTSELKYVLKSEITH